MAQIQIGESLTRAKQEIAEAVLRKNPQAGTKEIAASPEWKKKFGKDACGGQTLGKARIAVGITNGATKKTSQGQQPAKTTKGKAKILKQITERGITLDQTRSSLELVRKHFGGKLEEAIEVLEAVEAVGSIEEVKAALDGYADLGKLLK